MSCVTFPGKGHLEACACFPLNFAYVPFPFADLTLSPFTALNHPGVQLYAKSYRSPREFLNLGVVLGTPMQTPTPLKKKKKQQLSEPQATHFPAFVYLS